MEKHGILNQIIPAEQVDYEGTLDAVEKAEKGMKATAAILKAGHLPQVRGYLSKILDEAGATLESSAKVIAEAQGAVQRQVVSFQGSSEVVDVGPDHMIRIKAAELNLKARGELRDQDQVNMFFDMPDEMVAKIASGEVDPATLINLGPRAALPTE